MLVVNSCVNLGLYRVKTFHTKTQSYRRRRQDDFRSLRLRSCLCAFARNFFIVLLFVPTVAVWASTPAKITISVVTAGDVKVEAELPAPARSWSFRNAYAGALGFAERVKDFRATNASGQDAGVKKSASGEYRSERDATRIAYTVDLSQANVTEVPHVSWLVPGRGFLMFADLIPGDIETLSAEFKLPFGWTLESSVLPDKDSHYAVLDPESAVFVVGNTLREIIAGDSSLHLVVSGAWPFKDAKVFSAATEVLKYYTLLTRYRLRSESLIAIAPFPLAGSKWKAETRGSTVMLLIDPSVHFHTWIDQLKIIFTHEMLHLWVPNSLHLEGDYDWFFEGFTLYAALRAALELKVINFKVFLKTLAGAYDAYLSHPDDVSLVEASETRWTTGSNQVYVKGMLVAFLYDLKLRKCSGGSATIADRYRELFGGRVAANANGNEAIITLLDAAPAMNGFGKLYVENNTRLELEQLLPAYGLTLDASRQKSQLQVSRNLTAEQKQLLRSLGYRD
jgi:hypothetical protein